MTRLVLAIMSPLIIFASTFSMEGESTEFVDLCSDVKLVILGFVLEGNVTGALKFLRLTVGSINKELYELAQSKQLCEPINVFMKEFIISSPQRAKALVGKIGKRSKDPLVTGIIRTFVDMLYLYPEPENLIMLGIDGAWPNDNIKLLLAHPTDTLPLNTALFELVQWSTNRVVYRDSDVELAKMLIEHGADVNARSGDYTPLMLVVERPRPGSENEDLIKLFIQKCAHIDAQRKTGHTALMVACANRHDHCLQMACQLMDAGADLDIKDCRGKTAKEIAKAYGSGIAGMIDAYEIGSFWVDIRKFFSFGKGAPCTKYCCGGIFLVVCACGGCCHLFAKLFEAVKLKRD